SSSNVVASLAVTIAAPGLKSGATLRISAIGIATLAAERAFAPRFETPLLMFLICWLPPAELAQRAGSNHSSRQETRCIDFSPRRWKKNGAPSRDSADIIFPA